MNPLERVAHDIICIVKYNSTGGTASAAEVKRVADYLGRIGQLPAPTPRVAVSLPRPGSNPPLPPGAIRPLPPPNPPRVNVLPRVVIIPK